MPAPIALIVLTAIVAVGVIVLRKRLSSGGASGYGCSRGRPGADKH